MTTLRSILNAFLDNNLHRRNLLAGQQLWTKEDLLDEAEAAIITLITECLAEVVGEDEEAFIKTGGLKNSHNPVITANNKLRAEQRARATAIMEGKE